MGESKADAPVANTTIVMLSVDEASLLEHSLPAAAAQPGAEVVVVDNAGSDATPDLCAAHDAGLLSPEASTSTVETGEMAVEATAGIGVDAR